MDESIIAIAGIAGTLLGTIAGVVSAVWIQQRQLQHEDRTRFHAQRLATYADFNDACNRMISSLVLAGPVPAEDAARFIRAFETVRLISSKAVWDAAASVHAAVGAAWRGEVTPVDGTFPEFNTRVAKLCVVMRAETGVDKD
jgi:hypothetical protein